MIKRNTSALIIFILLISPLVTLFGQSNTEKLERLTLHLATIERDARKARLTGGWICIGTGGLFGLGGAALLQTQDYYGEHLAGGIFIGTGVVLAGTGGLILALPTEYEKRPREYSEMEQTSDRDLQKKIAFGETCLQSLADKAQMNRYISAGGSIVTGVAEFLYLPDYGGSNLYSGAVTIGLGIVNLLVPTVPERENKAYRGWKAGASKSTYLDEARFTPAFVSIPGGVAISFDL